MTLVVNPEASLEGSMFFIIGMNLDLIIPRKSIHEGHVSKLHVLSIMISVMGSKNSSFRQALLRSQKSMHMQIFPFFLVTGTMLAGQSRCYSSLMNLQSTCFRTSASIASLMSGRKRHCYCLTGIASGWMLNRWVATFELSPGLTS